MRILVLDDEFVALSRMTKLLGRWGKVDAASSGIQALEMFTGAYQGGQPYDLITFDIQIPDGDGLDLLKKFYELEEEWDNDGWHSKKIVITAQGNLENIQKAARNRCDAFLVKPVKLTVLEEKIKQIWH